MKTSGKIQMALALATLAAVPVAANAATSEVVQLQLNGAITTINDNGVGDLDGRIGYIQLHESIGSPTDTVLGTLSSTHGPGTQLQNDTLELSNSSNTSSATITILLSDFGFAPSKQSAGTQGTIYTQLASGTFTPPQTGGSASISVNTYVDPNGGQILLSNYSGLTNTGAASASISGSTSTSFPNPVPPTASSTFILGSGDFSLAQVATITLSPGTDLNLSATSYTNVQTIASPEPASFALLGAAGLPLLLRRRKGAAA